MSAKGKELKVNVSTDRATAISSSAGSYPNVLYFPIDDDNVIIFNGNIYDWNASVTSPKLISSGDLNTYRGTQHLGVYYANYGNSISNKPSGVSQFALHVLLENNDSSTIQVLYSKNKIYTRAYESSSWSSWTEIGAGGITSIPQASSSALGGIKIGYSNDGRNYAVKLDSSGKAYVNVPWTDNNTTYSAGAGLSLSGTAFSLVKATPTTLGGVKVSSTEISTISTVAATIFGSQNRIYPVQLAYPSGSAGTGGNKVLSVYVPWENTTYSVVSTSKNGLVSMDSALAELAYEDKDAGNLGSLARFGEMGMLEASTIVEDDLALVNKSNRWTAYQDFKSGAGNSGSDMRFKREVTCMPDVLDNLMSLNVIKYIWEHPDENGIRCTFGVKADQLLSLGGVYATMVHSRADKYDTKWVEYDRFGVLAIKALQEVVMRNKQLESRIEYLEDTINSMRRVWEENS